ncbi:MAG: hypothetical protein QG602_3813 [Verrucomicrobiota bacterium]|nr:hypothetical protein [Verrucomicrobiota bacterium]
MSEIEPTPSECNSFMRTLALFARVPKLPPPPTMFPGDYTPEQSSILTLLDRVEALEARVAALEGRTRLFRLAGRRHARDAG